MKKKLILSAVLPAGIALWLRHSFSFIIFLFLLSVAPRFGSAQAVLLNENFGTGTTLPTGWTASGTNWQNTTSNASSGYAGASGGSNAEFMNDNTATQTLTYSNNLSTIGYTNISVLWGSRIVYSFLSTTTITVTLSWSADGTTWNNVIYTNNTSTTWGLVNGGNRIALPAGAAGVANLRLRLTATAAAAAFLGSTSYKVDDFMVDGCPATAGTISYAGTPFCTSLSTAQSVTSTGLAGGTYSSTTGLSINATTGAITPATSTPGTYTVTYTLSPGGGCTAVSTTTNVTITAAPSATISYAGSPYCSNVGTATVTRTGTAGGTYSSTTGLIINASTGAITTNTSTAGTYIVTYTVAAAGGCGIFTTTASVTITAAPTATISFSGSPYCSNAGIVNITRTGTTGGTYSSTAGLVIDANTGSVNTTTSTAGPYTVTYTIAASGGCALFSTTTSITISTAPSATINYAGSPYCSNAGTATVTRTGTAGGTYSSTTGLVINATTGAITLASSTAGTHTITYTIAANGGCALYTTTTNITITAAPFATISYAGTPYCSNSGTIGVSRTGNVGGVYSSTSGLVVNSGTGDINTSTSTAGTYTVTYTIAASGGCALYSTTTSVTITAAPSATISYAGSPYCSSFGTATATRTGTTGGTYTSTTGLVIDAATGSVNTATSTPGTYTVTYTIAAGGGCSIFITTATITISAASFATISYLGTPFCTTSGVIAVNRTGTAGGTYSSSAGLTINTSTGAITPSTSTTGTYTITYTIAAAGGCALYTTTTSVTITAAPTAAISYTSNPYCSNAGTVNITRTGTAGGTYSSSAGLVIDASTGAINTSTSTAGTYTVTYTIAASGGCALFSTTTGVTITTPPSATINYAGSPYCASAGIATATRTGTTGGTYSSTTGLVIDANTGTVTLASSTAGTYTVTYTIAASGGCAAFTTTANLTITATPSASISYVGNPFCSNNGVVNVTQTGTTGGSYSSTTGLIINTITGAVNTATSTAGTYTVVYTVAASGGCSQYQTSTTITIQTAGIWTGAVNTDYNNAQNWSCGGVPTVAINIVIPTGLSRYPIVSVTNSANNISIGSNASLVVNGGTMRIAGTVTNNGKYSSVNGATEFIGSTLQTIPAGLFDSAFVKSLTVNNAAGVTLTTALNLTGSLKITSGQLNTGDLLVLKSYATGTAMVDNITSASSTPVNGKVTVERYITGRRKYRLITSSVTTSTANTLTAGQEALSIWGAWQNSGSTATANSGTIITGGSNADGFDTQTTNASLFTYDDVNKRFTGFTTANGKNTKYTPLKAGVAYYMFVYGDRTNTITTSTPNNTTLRTTGTLLTGTQSYTTISAIPLTGVTGRFTFLGNPFASAINWSSIPKTNLENTYWGWDPNLSSTGGYVTVMTNGSVTLQAPFSGTTGLNQFIQPGQGFFVRTSGSSPTLTIREQDKVSNFNSNAFRVTGTADQLSLIAVNLYYPNGSSKVLADGVLGVFDASFSIAVGEEDAAKFTNTAESMAIANDTNLLSIDSRPLPQNGDTLSLNILRYTKPQYTLQIFAQQLEGSNVQAYLQDRYLNTLQLLSLTDTNNITFTTNLTIPASIDANRFRILFRSTPIILPLQFTSVKATVVNKEVQVDWAAADESGIKKYEVERSFDGTSFSKVAEVSARKIQVVESYSWLDKMPFSETNFYRIRAIKNDGQFVISKTVAVKLSVATVVSISPNPVISNQIQIHCNDLEKGKYIVKIISPQGQQVLQQTINHVGGAINYPLHFDKTLASGTYYFDISNEHWIHNELLIVK